MQTGHKWLLPIFQLHGSELIYLDFSKRHNILFFQNYSKYSASTDMHSILKHYSKHLVVQHYESKRIIRMPIFSHFITDLKTLCDKIQHPNFCIVHPTCNSCHSYISLLQCWCRHHNSLGTECTCDGTLNWLETTTKIIWSYRTSPVILVATISNKKHERK